MRKDLPARSAGDCTRDVDSFEYGAISGVSTPPPAHVEPGVVSPIAIHRVEADYSDEAKAARRSGVVRLSVIVDTEGNPRDVRVVESLGMGLDEKAIEAAGKWKFRPGTQNGKPVEMRVTLEMEFHVD